MNAQERAAAVLQAIQALAPYYGYTAVEPSLILAQAAYETGHFTSRLIVEDNNAFGMRQPQQRPNVSDGPGASGFATYSDLFASVQDYFLRQQYFRVPNVSGAAYVDATIASGYNTSPQYRATWLQVWDRYRDDPTNVPGTGGTTVPPEPAPDPDETTVDNNPTTQQSGGNVGGLLLVALGLYAASNA